MKLMQDLTKKRKMYQILSCIIIILDLISFCTMEIIDIYFTVYGDDYNKKFSLFLIKIIVMIAFIGFIFCMTILRFINTLLISAIAYLVIGIILFCYLLIDQLKSLHSSSTESRPVGYFQYDIGSVLVVLNILTGFFRISGSIVIIFFITIYKIEKRRSKILLTLALAEQEENLINMDESLKVNNMYTVNDNSMKLIKKDSFLTLNENPDEMAIKLFEEKHKKLPFRKTSENSGSVDSYGKFETPKTLNKLSALLEKK